MTAKAIEDKITKVQTKIVEPFVDKILGKIFSKKLIVFGIATWLVRVEVISGREWSVFAGLYVVGLIWLNYLKFMSDKREQEFGFKGNREKTIVGNSESNEEPT